MDTSHFLFNQMIDDDFLDALGDSVDDEGELKNDAEDSLRQMDHVSSRAKYWKKVEEFKKYKDALEVKDDDE